MPEISPDPDQVARTERAIGQLLSAAQRLSRWYGEWFYASAIQLDQGTWKNTFTVIYPLKADEAVPPPQIWDYGTLRLSRGTFSLEDVQHFLNKLAKQQTFFLPGLPETRMIAYLYPENPPYKDSSQSHGSPSGYPFDRYEFSVLGEYRPDSA